MSEMKMEAVLIVGGPHDGERVQIEWSMPYLYRYEAPPLRFTPLDAAFTETVQLTQVRYVRQKFGTSDRSFAVFAPEAASYADTMQRLLDGYRPKVDE